MKIKSNVIALSTLLTGVIITACSSGGGQSQQTQNTTQSLPQGPVSYSKIISDFSPQRSLDHSFQSASSNCGSLLSNGGNGALIATGFINLIPTAGPILGSLTTAGGIALTLFGNNDQSTCITQEFNSIESQLVYQQQEITNIETNLSLSSNNIWTAIAQNAVTDTSSAYTNFLNSISTVTSLDGVFIRTYSAANFYNTDTLQLTNYTLDQLLKSKSQLDILQSSYSGIENTNLPLVLQQISGSLLNTSACPSVNGVLSCYQSVSNDSSTYLGNLLSSMSVYLSSQLTSSINSGQNVIPLFDNYNDTLMSYYQQSLAAIQEVYHIAYLANYINYAQSTSGIYNDLHAAVIMPDVLNIPGTYYSSSSGVPYNTAQQNLTLLTAALVNQLYTNVVGYIVTDKPIGLQLYPDTQRLPYLNESGVYAYGESINYTQLIGASLPSNMKTASQFLYNALSSSQIGDVSEYDVLISNMSSMNLLYYQYSGLANVAQCMSSIESYNAQNGINGNIESLFGNLGAGLSSTSCPSILTDNSDKWANNAVVTNNTIQPYVLLSESEYPILTGNVTNNINTVACNPNPVGNIPGWNMYLYTPSSSYPSTGAIPGTPYLMCGNWQTTGISSNFGQYGGNNTFTTPTWSLTTTTDSNSGTQINFSGTTNVMYPDSNDVWSSQFGPNVELTIGNVYSDIISSWINENLPSTWPVNGILHVIAVQSTTPDGFIAPYGVNITYNGRYQVGVAPNPNVINANVTMENQPIYSNILVNSSGIPYTTLAAMTQSYPWTPVLSESAIYSVVGYDNLPISVLQINGFVVVPIGTTSSGNGNVTYCFANPASPVSAQQSNVGYTSSVTTECY